MDNGEVIPGLDEQWTLGGAKASEWMAGFVMLILAQEVLFAGSTARTMPLLMMIWIGSTYSLMLLRKRFPDEERGICNAGLVAIGVAPPGIPTPAELQPIWSACPMRELPPTCLFRTLGFDELLKEEGSDDDQADFADLHERRV